jgi:hypothetical protein
MSKYKEIKEEMRLYEIYSTAALTGLITTSAFTGYDDLTEQVDEITKEMISRHFVHLEFLERVL